MIAWFLACYYRCRVFDYGTYNDRIYTHTNNNIQSRTNMYKNIKFLHLFRECILRGPLSATTSITQLLNATLRASDDLDGVYSCRRWRKVMSRTVGRSFLIAAHDACLVRRTWLNLVLPLESLFLTTTALLNEASCSYITRTTWRPVCLLECPLIQEDMSELVET